ncbi:mannitol dehydrogenase family protein [Nonomuraea phyllanthi]|uniref:mannitol dehydrogenase family protein n=1 Tax=Nonomuraea phyllanthi TaxID=2219224 RepID=UPI0012931B06|nr:mannitol dehydrogenase family protein [Nonomuraea phyllanthi]QFY05794.1 mannitol dehydrogenase family protein [Nonomuraea phyllanthi]
MILHFGLGAFHRAHQAVHTQEAGDGWAICSVAPRSPDVVRALRAQNHRYTLLVREGEDVSATEISSVRRTLHAPTETEQVIQHVADPAVRVITLTITEKAYADAGPGSPIGLLAAGLARRTAAGAGPVAVVSCDNLLSNGPRLREAVLRVSGNVPEEVSFPATVVDRMVPATTPEDLATAAKLTGREDLAAVVAEPYSQWVLQDDFPGGRPAWERAGAQFVADVEPYERVKLRVLNGVHSTLAYTGALTGHEYVSGALDDPVLARLAERLIREDVLPVLTAPPGVDLPEYGAQVLARMRNRALRHRCAQIAMDGSLKVPIRLLGTVRDRLAAGGMPRWACLAVAAWLRHVTVSTDDAGRPVEVDDPRADDLRRLAHSPRRLIAAVAPDLADHAEVVARISADLADFAAYGVRECLERA